jgi:nucleotide-binding universal stress UspA family protein
MRVIAALDNSLAAHPVLATTLAFGRLVGADVEALHVAVDGQRVARNTAEAEHVPFHTQRGPVVQCLVEAALDDDVLALVVGARGSPLGLQPLGSTALAVATSLTKPLVVVPPDARRPGEIRRVLVPLEGVRGGTHEPRAIIALADETDLEVVVMHVLEEGSLPLFTDQPQHEHPARVEEFLRRYCPWGIGRVRLEVRVGRCDELVPLVAEQTDADIIALGWAQELVPNRAPIVRAVLERAHVPVLLVPVQVDSNEALHAVSGEVTWSKLQSSPA